MPPEGHRTITIVEVSFSGEEFDLLVKRAAQLGKNLSEYTHDVIVKGLNRWQRKQDKKADPA